MTTNQIDTKTITELLGMNFYIPEYQRGYRWTKDNVTQLLDDIWEYRQEPNNRHTFYCLQPVVVRKTNWPDKNGQLVEGYELIDGQQRLTTIHRILTCIFLERYGTADLLSRGYKSNLFSLYYKTRLESKDFLNSNSYDASKPDLYYMSEAYESIKKWLYDTSRGIPDDTMDEVRRLFLPFIKEEDKEKGIQPEWSVQVIWYEIIEDTSSQQYQKSEELFKRLNRGKIPLTSAELIKAKFVNKDSLKGMPPDEQIKKKTELIQIWDEIEVQLNAPAFWAFITNKKAAAYSNKIELLFDTITGKEDDELDPLFSFIHFFDKEENSETLWKKWIEVEEIYRALLFWYKDINFYHKIGFLIEAGTSIKELTDLKKDNLKSDFEDALNKLIASKIPINWEDLRFDNSAHKTKIAHVLLLHNLEIIRKNGHTHEFFPFQIYKNITKSLEHIHAQNIEEMNPNDQNLWKAWLKEHLLLLKDSASDPVKAVLLTEEAEQKISSTNFSFADFKILAKKILELLPSEEEEDSNTYLHKLENMALLGLTENIILGNSVFEAKRRKIVELDKNGAFIPIATKRIFLKYYSTGSNNQYSLWTKEERKNYLTNIREKLNYYLLIANNNNTDNENQL